MCFSAFSLHCRGSALYKAPPYKGQEDNTIVSSQKSGVSWSIELGKDFPKGLSPSDRIERYEELCLVNK